MNAPAENRILTIEGDLVRIQRTTIEREVRTSDFIAEIARLQPLDTGPLPHGCVWYSRCARERDRPLSIYVIKRPACMQLVHLKTSPSGSAEQTVRELVLSWPTTLWFVRGLGEAVIDLHLACVADAGFIDPDTPLHCLLMPNLYDSGHGAVCMGNLVISNELPLALRAEEMISRTLDSLWNSDLMPNFGGSGISSLEDWAAKSAATADFHRQMTFPDHRRQTLERMLAWLREHCE